MEVFDLRMIIKLYAKLEYEFFKVWM